MGGANIDPPVFEILYLLPSTFEDQLCKNAQLFPNGKHAHREPTKIRLSVGASYLLKELCISTTRRVPCYWDRTNQKPKR
jgi:hypothetical protein